MGSLCPQCTAKTVELLTTGADQPNPERGRPRPQQCSPGRARGQKPRRPGYRALLRPGTGVLRRCGGVDQPNPERGRPRPQQRSTGRARGQKPRRPDYRTLLRPRTGALRQCGGADQPNPERGRPGHSSVRLGERVGKNRHVPAIEHCCARGRALSGGAEKYVGYRADVLCSAQCGSRRN
jgi:hypothetical protein